jgi:hypothetical protein
MAAGGGAGGGAGGPSTLTTAVPSALKRPAIRVHPSVTEGGGGDDGNGEPKVDESIELGPPTRLLDGWSVRATEAPAAVPREDDNDDDSRQATMFGSGSGGRFTRNVRDERVGKYATISQ